MWNHVIGLYPSDNRVVLAYSNRAEFFQQEGKPREALNDLLMVVQWNQNNDNALEKIGKIYGKDLHDMANSFKYFQQALQANPQNLEVIKDLVTVYGMQGDFKKSLEYSFRGLEIKKDDAFLLYNVGVNYNYLGQVDLGKDYMNKAFEIDPSLKGK
ncbi:MAG: hypothetical protein NTW16_13840 [Bacteroidetes bacterium]|nr:hypothetical protein [Bacteroidota bacterium]